MLLDGKYHIGLLRSFGGHRSLDRRPQDLLLGGTLWPWSPWELRTV
jgi:hypothetical protein